MKLCVDASASPWALVFSPLSDRAVTVAGSRKQFCAVLIQTLSMSYISKTGSTKYYIIYFTFLACGFARVCFITSLLERVLI